MSTERTLSYRVTLYFQFTWINRTVQARCVADAIEKVRAMGAYTTAAIAVVAQPLDKT
jgi:hypothetical protein